MEVKTHTSTHKKLVATLVAVFAVFLIICVAISISKDRTIPMILFEITADTSETEIKEYAALLENNQALLAANGIASEVLKIDNGIVLNLKSQNDLDNAKFIIASHDNHTPNTVIAQVTNTDAVSEIDTLFKHCNIAYAIEAIPGGMSNLLVAEEDQAFALITLGVSAHDFADKLVFDKASVVNLLMEDYGNKTSLVNEYPESLYQSAAFHCGKALDYYLVSLLKEKLGATDGMINLSQDEQGKTRFAAEIVMTGTPREEDKRRVVQLLESSMDGAVVDNVHLNEQSISLECRLERLFPNPPNALSAIEYAYHQEMTTFEPGEPRPAPNQPPQRVDSNL